MMTIIKEQTLLLITFLLLFILLWYEEVETQKNLLIIKTQLNSIQSNNINNNDVWTHLRGFIEPPADLNKKKEAVTSSLPPPSLNNAPIIDVFPESCKNEALWGRDHHGGWYICKDAIPSKNCIVYSFGLGADWSFDNAAEQNNCEVHGFDPTNLLWKQGMHGKDFSGFDYAKQYPSQLKFFHNWGIGAVSTIFPPGTIPQDWPGLGDPPMSKSNTEPWEVKSLEKTILDLGHSNSKITILKIDIEGGEWVTLSAALNSRRMVDYLSKGNIEQMLLEFHWDPYNRAQNSRYNEILSKVEDLGFVPWKVVRHEGSDCCLDISYVWKSGRTIGRTPSA